MPKSSQYVGLDVSLKETSICVIDDVGKIVWRGRTESTPEAIAGRRALPAGRTCVPALQLNDHDARRTMFRSAAKPV